MDESYIHKEERIAEIADAFAALLEKAWSAGVHISHGDDGTSYIVEGFVGAESGSGEWVRKRVDLRGNPSHVVVVETTREPHERR